MTWLQGLLRSIPVVTVGALMCLGPARAADPARIDKQIAAVESGLRPTVRPKGHSKAWSLVERMKERHVPAVSIAVIDNYQLAWARAYGLADTTAGRAATVDTLFQAASMSKPVAAMGALRLVQEGVLQLDRNVNEQLTNWKVPDNKYTAEHAVDLRSLLSHTAGLTVHGFGGYKPGDPLPTLVDILDGKKPANNQPVRVNKVPGADFRYSGGGTTVGQLLVMDVTGQPYALFMQDTVLAPLGMTASSYQQPMASERVPYAASGHDREAKPVEGLYRIHPEQAAAGLWTTPTDLARYIVEVQLAHEGKSAKVLGRELVEAMLKPQAGGPVGLGPFLGSRKDLRWFAHGGQNLGFSCQFIGLLDRGQGAIVMTNSDVGAPLVAEVINSIAAAYDWTDYLEPDRDVVELPTETLDRYVGKYDLGGLGTFVVRREEKRLLGGSASGGAEIELYFESPTEFFTDIPGTDGRFVVEDDRPGASAVLLKMGGREMRVKRLEK